MPDTDDVLMRTATAFGIEAQRLDGLTGASVGPDGREEKLA